MVNKEFFMSSDLIKHCNKVKLIAEYLCSNLNVSKADAQYLLRAAEIHDIGKYFIPNEILNVERELTFKEREVVDMHALYGFIKSVEQGEHPIVCQLILMHHGIRVTSTVLKSQVLFCEDRVNPLYPILMAADIYEALTSDRVYRRACTPEVALNVVSKNKEIPSYVVEALSTYK